MSGVKAGREEDVKRIKKKNGGVERGNNEKDVEKKEEDTEEKGGYEKRMERQKGIALC